LGPTVTQDFTVGKVPVLIWRYFYWHHWFVKCC